MFAGMMSFSDMPFSDGTVPYSAGRYQPALAQPREIEVTSPPPRVCPPRLPINAALCKRREFPPRLHCGRRGPPAASGLPWSVFPQAGVLSELKSRLRASGMFFLDFFEF